MSATPEINGPKNEAEQPSILGALGCTHGTQQVVVMPDEDRKLYHSYLQTFRDKCRPEGAIEEHLVQSLADISWRLNRVVALESNLLSISYSPRDLVAGLLDQAKALASLSLHSQRLSRQFERTLAQLHQLQKTRIAEKQQELVTVLDLIEIHQSKGKTYNPSDDGFVFSDLEIARAMRLRSSQRELDRTRKSAAARFPTPPLPARLTRVPTPRPSPPTASFVPPRSRKAAPSLPCS
jgi:hypothetical protein